MKPVKIELLAPARDADSGIEAIRHGADAVYIGGPAFGARAAAGNSVADIARLCQEAHFYSASVHVALNTILYEEELAEAERLVAELYEAGVDALIVQDLALLKLNIPPIALHASTQMDNRTARHLRRLQELGFSRAVLARELSLEDIAAIHREVDMPLEAFVHGALCVSFSGQCYASQCAFGRSANRGECAQFCRLRFDLVDNAGNVVERGHLLSLRDMNRSAQLEAMMDAGVTSFKIEGRLKDLTYVKNVTAYYRQAIDAVIARREGDYVRSSCGRQELNFTPDPLKSFNRGFTAYYLHGRRGDEFNFVSPKSIGEPIGRAGSTRGGWVEVKPRPGVELAQGDGLCFVDTRGQLQGFRVNVLDGRFVQPRPAVSITAGTPLFRNHDKSFSRKLAAASAERKIGLRIVLKEEENDSYSLTMKDERGIEARVVQSAKIEPARSPQQEYIRRQLSKLGGTPFYVKSIAIDTQGERFVPASVLSSLRQRCTKELVVKIERVVSERTEHRLPFKAATVEQTGALDYRANVANSLAEEAYHQLGWKHVAPAYELQPPRNAAIMFCRHCLRYALGACAKHGGKRHLPSTLALRISDGRCFPLEFDCQHCQMIVHAPRSK